MNQSTYSQPGSEGSDLGNANLKSFSVIHFTALGFVLGGVLQLDSCVNVIVLGWLVSNLIVESGVAKL